MDKNEKYIVNNLRDHREEIDLDNLWDEVSPQIPKKKKRRLFGFWIFGGLIIGLMLISLGWMLNSENGSENDTFSQVELLKVDHKEIGVEKGLVFNENRLNTENKTVIEEKVLPTGNLDLERNNFQAEVLNVTPIQKGKEISAKNAIPTINEPSSIGANAEKSTNLGENISTLISAKNIPENTSFTSKEKVIKNSKNSDKREISDALSLPLLNNSIILHNRILEIPEFSFANDKINIAPSPINKWSVYLRAGAGFASRNLNIKSTELNDERNRRNNVEDILGAWEAEVGIAWRISPKLKIMTGLNYTQIHEKARFETDYFIDFEVQSNGLVHRQDGSVDNVVSTSSGQGLRHTEEVRYNQLRLLQIPVRLSYEVITIKKLEISIGALAAYTINQNYSGYISLSNSQKSYDLQLDKERKFRSQGSASYGLFLDGVTHLSDMLDLSFSIGYKQTRKINSEIYLIDQQYNSLTITSGFNHRF